jgi:hypothetical protein
VVTNVGGVEMNKLEQVEEPVKEKK